MRLYITHKAQRTKYKMGNSNGTKFFEMNENGIKINSGENSIVMDHDGIKIKDNEDSVVMDRTGMKIMENLFLI
jgi:hypothetical protein